MECSTKLRNANFNLQGVEIREIIKPYKGFIEKIAFELGLKDNYWQDCIAIAALEIVKSKKQYDENKAAFNTYVYVRIYRNLKKLHIKIKRQERNFGVPFSNVVFDPHDPNSECVLLNIEDTKNQYSDLEFDLFLEKFLSEQKELDALLFRLYFIENMTLAEVVEATHETGLFDKTVFKSPQGVTQYRMKKIRDNFKEVYQKYLESHDVEKICLENSE